MSKKFYLLHRKDYDPADTGGIKWNETNAIVVAESSPKKARKLAQRNGGGEVYAGDIIQIEIPFWTDPKLTVCKLLDIKNYKNVDVVIVNFGREG